MFIKTVRVLRNNWKKSVFFSCVTVWAVNYGNNKLIEHNKMRVYCEAASLFGKQYQRSDEKCRHITVLLNPVANKRKSRANYDKYCAPLLHLAGIRVSLVVTEAEGQASELMEIMDNTDAVLIAGGNGTVHEAVTGLLRRPDHLAAVHRFPIGILPVGKRNTIANELNKFGHKNLKHYEVLAESTMSAVRELLKPIDVMKIEGSKGRPVFALEELSFGKMRDTFVNVDKYWYLGSKLKPYLALISNSFKNLASVDNLRLSYSSPCTGCSQCYRRHEARTAALKRDEASRDTTRWWHIFVSRQAPNPGPDTNDAKPKVDLRSIINPNCSQWSTLEDINAANVLIKNTNECKLKVIIHWEPLAQSQFITDGVMLYNSQPLPQTTGSNVEMLEAMDINIDLKTDKPNEDEANSDVDVSDGSADKIQSDDSLANDQWFSIDTESYERQSIRITLLPKLLNIYALED